MDINFSNIGIKGGITGANNVSAERFADKPGVTSATANLTIGEHIAGISSGEPVAEVPASALTRGDKLGMLVDAAFNLPPPAMPDFK